jgi:hypothetical protein
MFTFLIFALQFQLIKIDSIVFGTFQDLKYNMVQNVALNSSVISCNVGYLNRSNQIKVINVNKLLKNPEIHYLNSENILKNKWDYFIQNSIDKSGTIYLISQTGDVVKRAIYEKEFQYVANVLTKDYFVFYGNSSPEEGLPAIVQQSKNGINTSLFNKEHNIILKWNNTIINIADTKFNKCEFHYNYNFISSISLKNELIYINCLEDTLHIFKDTKIKNIFLGSNLTNNRPCSYDANNPKSLRGHFNIIGRNNRLLYIYVKGNENKILEVNLTTGLVSPSSVRLSEHIVPAYYDALGKRMLLYGFEKNKLIIYEMKV